MSIIKRLIDEQINGKPTQITRAQIYEREGTAEHLRAQGRQLMDDRGVQRNKLGTCESCAWFFFPKEINFVYDATGKRIPATEDQKQKYGHRLCGTLDYGAFCDTPCINRKKYKLRNT